MAAFDFGGALLNALENQKAQERFEAAQALERERMAQAKAQFEQGLGWEKEKFDKEFGLEQDRLNELKGQFLKTFGLQESADKRETDKWNYEKDTLFPHKMKMEKGYLRNAERQTGIQGRYANIAEAQEADRKLADKLAFLSTDRRIAKYSPSGGILGFEVPSTKEELVALLSKAGKIQGGTGPSDPEYFVTMPGTDPMYLYKPEVQQQINNDSALLEKYSKNFAWGPPKTELTELEKLWNKMYFETSSLWKKGGENFYKKNVDYFPNEKDGQANKIVQDYNAARARTGFFAPWVTNPTVLNDQLRKQIQQPFTFGQTIGGFKWQ